MPEPTEDQLRDAVERLKTFNWAACGTDHCSDRTYEAMETICRHYIASSEWRVVSQSQHEAEERPLNPQERTMQAIDTGPCHRLLELGEDVLEGDDVYSVEEGRWYRTGNLTLNGHKQADGIHYSRRMIPEPPDGYAVAWAKHWTAERQDTSLVIPDCALRIDGCDKEPRKWLGGCKTGITIAENLRLYWPLHTIAFAFPLVPQPANPQTEEDLDQAAVERVNRLLRERLDAVEVLWQGDELEFLGDPPQIRIRRTVTATVELPEEDMDELRRIAGWQGWAINAD